MKINKELENEIKYLDKIMQDNIDAAEFFNNFQIDLEDQLSLDNIEEENKIHYLLQNYAYKYLEYEFDFDDENDYSFYDEYLYKAVTKVDKEEYLSNPYLNNVYLDKKEHKLNNLALRYLKYKKYELFPLDEIKVDDKYQELSQIGYFDGDITYPALMEKNDVWMSVNPNEIKTMDKHIKTAKGDVLVLGLGLGYYPYMISLKEEVNRIVIIEKSKDVIDIFNKYLFNDFPHKNKITIIEDDAIKYLKENDKYTTFDVVFCDIWHNPNDGWKYFYQLKQIEKSSKKHFQYWLDKSLFALTRRYILTILVEQLSNEEIHYDEALNDDDKAINLLYKKIKDITLESKEDLYRLLSDEYLNDILMR